ncbi:jg21395 [Pararge aegeria aegeria]|uniref:Jg21395 protein n=1 Tax=Pararge aegeria aegeria TaxID=348720 RepID=A0A8S4S0Y3_9NEOP|nr:jg21395 [Pararge aegeria aegeria]
MSTWGAHASGMVCTSPRPVPPRCAHALSRTDRVHKKPVCRLPVFALKVYSDYNCKTTKPIKSLDNITGTEWSSNQPR